MNTNYVTAISPFNNYYNYSWSDNIYLTTDVGQAGKITQIAFYVYEGTNYTMSNQKILMRETSSSYFSNSSYPGETGFTTVYNGSITYNFSGASGWQVITLTTPFTYDGLSNLEVLCENESGTYTNNYNFFDVTTGYSNNRMKADYNDASLPTTCVNCGAYSNLTNIQLTMVCTSTMTVSPSSATICNGNSTSLSASGESTYTWSPTTGLSSGTGASVTANPTVTTVYTVNGKDASSCVQTKTVTVTVNPLPTISVSPSAPTICIGSSTTLTASGATSYAWSPSTGLSATTGASVTANPTSTTTYTVTGTGSNGCTNTKIVVVTVNPAPSLTFSPSSPAICVGNTTTLTASGATSYTWSPSTGLNTTTGASVAANPTVTTVYSINATGSNGCTGTQSLTVTVNPLPTLTLSPSSPAVCNGSTTTLTATGATTYTWSPATNLSATTGASVTANPTTATNYTLTGTNSNGCVNTKAFSVAVNSLPSLSINPSSATICYGNSTNLIASGATTYTWTPNTGLNSTTSASVTANPTSTTTYSISGTNSNGCVGTTTVTVNVNPLPTLSISATQTAICVGFSSNLAASGANTYTWSPATNLSATNISNVTANPSSTTLYTASGTNSNGCIGTQTINLVVNPLPNLSINPSTPIVLGGQGSTITANGASTYTWSPATNLSSTSGSTVTATPQITTNYTLTGTSSAGCVSNDIFSVGVELWQQTADTFHAPIYYNGNVGIGTNNPQAALDVVGNAIVTGTLTTGGLNSTNSNLRVSTPAVFSNSVTVSSLAGNSGLTPLYVDSAGNLRQSNVPPPCYNCPITTLPLCSAGNPAWLTGGNALGSYTNAVLGTCDNHDLVFETNSIQQMWLKTSGRLGIAIPQPQALFHVNTVNTGSLPGIIVDNENPSEGIQEFIVNSNGSTMINAIAGTNTDVFDVNFQIAQLQSDGSYQNQVLLPFFRIVNSGQGGMVGIGTKNTNSTINVVSAYKTLTVNGDVSLANYNTGTQTSNNQNDGLTALEILGNNQVPTRRGITVDNDPSGDLNFYINSNQGTADFHFKNGNPSTAPIELMKIDEFGGVTIPKLPSTAPTTGTTFNNVLVDNTGKLVPGAAVSSTSSASWVLGGNNPTANAAIGTSDGSDLPFITGTGTEAMRIDATGNVLINTATSTAPTYKKTLTVNGDVCLVNYASSGGHANDGGSGLEILGNSQTPTSRGISLDADPNGDFNFYINSWQTSSEFNFKSHNPTNGVTNLMTLNSAGQLFIGKQTQQSGGHTSAILSVSGDIVVGSNDPTNLGGGIYVTTTYWADFVFDKNYKLMTLNEVERFYKENHHLPNVPSEKEIKENGNNLAQTDVALLQKIEELTLYLVEQKKIAEQQQKEIDELKSIVKKNNK